MMVRSVFAALLAAALIAAGADHVLAADTPAASASVSASPSAALSSETLRKILQVMAAQGHDGDLGVEIANALGLSATGTPWPYRWFSVNATDTFVHGVFISRGSDRDMIVLVKRPDGFRAFRIHRDGSLVTALLADISQSHITMRAPAEAQAELAAELQFWTAGIDKFLPPAK
jgi:hypothetical protein